MEELKGHNGERIGQVAWHPFATLTQSRESLNLATSGADFNIQLWNLAGWVRLEVQDFGSPRRYPGAGQMEVVG